MSGGIWKAGTFSNPGTDMGVVPISQPADPATKRRAVRALASMAPDAAALGEVLEMLGLDAADGKIVETEAAA